ncbi:MAG TPA: Hsp70 family protein, partial [Mycobacteriales bacterium]|nr:Hsp70 family protein [Mycobacteriales bacterium]
MAALGIDLGTTYSVVAALDAHGIPQVIANREGEILTPSVVYFDGESPLVGSAAAAAGALSPYDCVELVKRHIGDGSWRCVTAGGNYYTAEQVSAMVLRRLAVDARTRLDEPCSEAVITVPAYFDDARRRATADAGIIAGLDVLRIVNEPTAAAVAYGFGRSVGGAGEPVTVMVYDWGGGTFDVTVVHVAGSEYQVLATAGDRNLGGYDIDNALMLYVDEHVIAQGGATSLDSDVAELMLREKCERAKRELSDIGETTVTVEDGRRTYRVEVTRPGFSELIHPLLQRTEEIVTEVMVDAGVRRGGLYAALLVGGSTRIPAVTRMLHRVTAARVRHDVHPEEAVALGAALLADHLSSQRSKGVSGGSPTESDRLVVRDVTAHSLGLIARSPQTGAEINSIVIERNAPLPARGRQRFHTLAENQDEILVVVTQGEDTDPAYVTVVGSARIPIPPSDESVEIDVVIGY